MAHPQPDEAAQETAIVVVSSLGHTLCHIGELVFAGAVVAVRKKFGLDEFEAVTLAGLGYVLMGIGALPFGYWSDAWGSARLLRIYFVAMAVGALAVAVAPDVFWLFASLTFLGIATSIYHPVGLAMISLGVRDRGRAMGINGAAGSLGVATGPALGLLAAALDMWQLAFVVLAILSLAALALMWVWMPSEPVRLSRLGLADRVAPERGSSRAWLGYLALALLMTSMMLGGFNYRCLLTALPPFLTGQAPGASEMARGGLFIWLTLVVGGVGQYVGGSLADGRRAWPIYLGFLGLLAPLAVTLANVEGSSAAAWVVAGLAVCLFALQPIENIILADWTTVGRRSLSYATKFAVTFGVGALGAPVVGLIWKKFQTVAPVFYVLGGSAVLMVSLSFTAMTVWKRAQRAE